jgi:cytochrome c553
MSLASVGWREAILGTAERRRSRKQRPNKQPNDNMNTLTKKAMILTAVLLTAALAQAGDAKENYDKGCAKCHGADGKGKTKMGEKLGIRDLTDAKVQAEIKDEAAFKAIKDGIKKDDKVLMKPSEGLSDDDIKALVKLVRGFKA